MFKSTFGDRIPTIPYVVAAVCSHKCHDTHLISPGSSVNFHIIFTHPLGQVLRFSAISIALSFLEFHQGTQARLFDRGSSPRLKHLQHRNYKLARCVYLVRRTCSE